MHTSIFLFLYLCLSHKCEPGLTVCWLMPASSCVILTCDFGNFTPECKCNGNGTRNGSLSCNQDSGQCPCKDNIHQRTCSECRDGFYSFPKSVEVDCLQCQCDYGGSIKEICEKINGLYKKMLSF